MLMRANVESKMFKGKKKQPAVAAGSKDVGF